MQDHPKKKKHFGYKPHRTQISAILSARLSKLNVSQNKIAHLLDVSQAYISRILRGTRIPRDIVLIRKLSRVLNVHEEILLKAIQEDLAEGIYFRYEEKEHSL